jgi:hypothetical protein
MTRPSPADYAEYRYIKANDVRYLPPNRHAHGRTVKRRIKIWRSPCPWRRPSARCGRRCRKTTVYATIFSFERPRSRSISTERRGRSLARRGATPRSSSPWPPPCQPLGLHARHLVFHINTEMFLAIRIPFMVVLHKFDRNASTQLVLAQSTPHSARRQRPLGCSPMRWSPCRPPSKTGVANSHPKVIVGGSIIDPEHVRELAVRSRQRRRVFRQRFFRLPAGSDDCEQERRRPNRNRRDECRK